MPKDPLFRRPLGATGETASIFGLGGEGVLRTFGYERQAADVIHAALDEGVTYFDSARAYAGSEQYYGAALGDMRERIFLTSKSHDRTRGGALAMLDQSLRNMATDHLDLWQLHDLRTWDELDAISAPGGAYEAFVAAKRAGKTRFIGLTGHHNPHVLLAAIERLAFDTVLIPVNPCEAHSEPFTQLVGKRAQALGMGVIGMKTLSRGLLLTLPGPPALQDLFDYALSQPIDVAIIGCDNLDQVEANAHAARRFQPMSEERQRALEAVLRVHAERMLYYRPPRLPA
ncbi:MAG: aldo/keto reductase [Candidatus Eremiobacteraeota bacterium]|nr:aldo/keto reductase [Candidatus Eremiobacteraeota bacterium]